MRYIKNDSYSVIPRWLLWGTVSDLFDLVSNSRIVPGTARVAADWNYICCRGAVDHYDSAQTNLGLCIAIR